MVVDLLSADYLQLLLKTNCLKTITFSNLILIFDYLLVSVLKVDFDSKEWSLKHSLVFTKELSMRG